MKAMLIYSVSLLKTSHQQHVIYAIAAFSGMRPSEIQRLQWTNIDLESGYIHADEHVCRKLQQERFIPIHDNLNNILSSDLRQYLHVGYSLSGHSGKHTHYGSAKPLV